MKEVSCRVTEVFFRALDRKHVPPEHLTTGTGHGVTQLRSRQQRMDWDVFVRFMSNAGKIWTPDELSDLGEEFMRSPHIRPFTLVARMLFDSVDFYRWVFNKSVGAAAQLFSCVDSTLAQQDEGQLQMEVAIRQGFRRSPELFHVFRGCFRAVPRLLGLPPAQVEVVLLGQSARYTIRVLPGGGFLPRLKNAIMAPFVARTLARNLKEALESLQQRITELEATRAELIRNGDQLRTINEASKELSRHMELSAVADAIAHLLYTRFACAGLRISLANQPGGPLNVLRESGLREEAPRSWNLQAGGELLGRIDAWGFADGGTKLFDDLVPWIAIALHNARSFAQVKEARGELERRVAERTRALSQTTATLELTVRQLTEMDEQKTKFFANASHELRTPLTLMLLPVESLLASGGLPADAREKLEGVVRGGYRLLKLINDLLDFSKIEAGKMQLRMGVLDLARLLEEMAVPWRPMLARRNVTLELRLPKELVTVGDAERLEQVALNLLSNAVKHVQDGGWIQVGAEKDGEIRFWVENSGEGIDQEEVAQVFERFAQSSRARGRRFGTTGLGLPLVKALVELHSGTISLHSEPGKLVRFEVVLPVGQAADADPVGAQPVDRTELRQYEIEATILPETPPELPPDAADAPADRPVLLLVEDNTDLRAFLAQALLPDYQVLEAADGAAGLELARQKHPDIVLSDLMMPEMDGMQLCRALKSDPQTSGAPFVLLTARGDLNSRLEGLDSGADDFLVKPFHLTEVQARLRTQLRIRRMSERLGQAEKLVALGTVVAGVAHEVRNPLNGIINALGPVKEMVRGTSPEAGELVELALGAARRVDQLTHRLLQQVRAGEGNETNVDLGENVSLAVQLLQHKAVAGPSLITQLGDPDTRLQVFGEPSSLNQVWVNLIDNAIQAAGPAGTVRVRAWGEEGKAVVEVSDDGPGIPAALLKRVFDPFFTTKAVGEGTGLGLALVRQVVTRHGGQITVQSAPGAGAKFTVTLPEARARLEAKHANG